MPITVKTTTKNENSGETLAQQARRLLAHAWGFRDCPSELLDELIAVSQFRRISKGEMVLRRNDPMSHVGMVVNGMADSSTQHANGHRHLVGLLLPGDFYGFGSLIDPVMPRHAQDLSGREDGNIMQIPLEAFRHLRAREPKLVMACEHQLARRLHLLFERMAVDPAMPLPMRTAGMLHTMGQLYGHAEGEHIVIDVRLSQTDMADWLGMSRQRVNFALKQLERDGLISLHYSALTILQPKALAELARG